MTTVQLAIEPDALELLRIMALRPSDPGTVWVMTGGQAVRDRLSHADLHPEILISPPLGSPVLGYPRLRKAPQIYRKPDRVAIWSRRSRSWAQWMWPNTRIEAGTDLEDPEVLAELVTVLTAECDREDIRQSWRQQAGIPANQPTPPLIGLLTDRPRQARLATIAIGLGLVVETLEMHGLACPRLILEPANHDRPQVESLWTESVLAPVLQQDPAWVWPWPQLHAPDGLLIPASARRPRLICTLALTLGQKVILETTTPAKFQDLAEQTESVRVINEGDSRGIAESVIWLAHTRQPIARSTDRLDP
ncbi:hypothetical protein [Mucisphaera sp.]|uniref:hypothetical protein n=1 Tax=Mucisphaera sp. TaxID=2913024 RepID=UPI003D0C6C5B